MNGSFTEFKGLFPEEKSKLLLDGKWGIEREAQRVTQTGDLALTPHPAAFGNKLENPQVTTDFSESQIELVTPPFGTVEETHDYLKMLQLYVESELKNELLWPLSMPPRLPEEDKIPIAKFDGSYEGREKEIYRNGLALRHGKKMQMISGIHFNFSYGENLLDYLYEQLGSGIDKRNFIDNLYLSASRNILRYRWLLIYLFGASPNVDPTYYTVIDDELKIVSRCCPECCTPFAGIGEAATSLRVSRFGYSDSVQGKYSVSYNSLRDYVGGIRKLMATESRKYSRMGLYRDGRQIQLNTNILQKESEFYSAVRLKEITQKGETQMEALEKRGVKYAELRIIDLDPFEKTGISLQQMRFLQVFMLYCLFEKSEPIQTAELQRINKNHHLTAISGRRRNLELYRYGRGTIKLKEWSSGILSRIRLIATRMDSAGGDSTYQDCVEAEYRKVLDQSLLPSARIWKELKERKETFLAFGNRKAAEYKWAEMRGGGTRTEVPEENSVRLGIPDEGIQSGVPEERLRKEMTGDMPIPGTKTRQGDYIKWRVENV